MFAQFGLLCPNGKLSLRSADVLSLHADSTLDKRNLLTVSELLTCRSFWHVAILRSWEKRERELGENQGSPQDHSDACGWAWDVTLQD